jgi:hypothetical protein
MFLSNRRRFEFENPPIVKLDNVVLHTSLLKDMASIVEEQVGSQVRITVAFFARTSPIEFLVDSGEAAPNFSRRLIEMYYLMTTDIKTSSVDYDKGKVPFVKIDNVLLHYSLLKDMASIVEEEVGSQVRITVAFLSRTSQIKFLVDSGNAAIHFSDELSEWYDKLADTGSDLDQLTDTQSGLDELTDTESDLDEMTVTCNLT